MLKFQSMSTMFEPGSTECDSKLESSADEWTRDVLLAKSAIEDTISKMPMPLRVEACCVGYQFWKVRREPRDPDCLGDYARAIPQIRLFLSNIRKYCSASDNEFSKEVVTTYLHELGHHLGMGETHLESWGL
jgi:Zincin-like metallopeptidase